MKKKLLIVLFFLITFICGYFTGVLYKEYKFRQNFMYFNKPHKTNPFIQDFAGILNLSDNQVSEIESIFDEQKFELNRLRKNYRPQILEIREKTKHKIESVLNPEQKIVFNKLCQRMNKRFNNLKKRQFNNKYRHNPPIRNQNRKFSPNCPAY
jgi:hypothetical protein